MSEDWKDPLRKKYAKFTERHLRWRIRSDTVECLVYFFGSIALLVAGLWWDWRFLALVPIAFTFYVLTGVQVSLLRKEVERRELDGDE